MAQKWPSRVHWTCQLTPGPTWLTDPVSFPVQIPNPRKQGSDWCPLGQVSAPDPDSHETQGRLAVGPENKAGLRQGGVGWANGPNNV